MSAKPKRAKYQPAPAPPIVAGTCTKHGGPVTPITRVCLSCHHEALDAAGFNWRDIAGLRRDMGGATGFNRARLEP